MGKDAIPAGVDALRAIRWYTNELEQALLTIDTREGGVPGAVRDMLEELFAGLDAIILCQIPCPKGTERCPDCTCKPSCMMMRGVIRRFLEQCKEKGVDPMSRLDEMRS